MRGLALLLALAALPAYGQSVADRLNDYPTAARADYVFACMASNGQTRQTLEKCSCSIDQIATILPPGAESPDRPPARTADHA